MYGQYQYGLSIATIIGLVATLGAGGGLLSKYWGQSDYLGFKKKQNTFFVYNWFWNKGVVFLTLFSLSLFILYFNFQAISFITFYTLLLSFAFFQINLLVAFFIAQKKVIFGNALQLIFQLLIFIWIGIIKLIDIKNVNIIFCGLVLILIAYSFLIHCTQLKKYGLKKITPSKDNISFVLLQWGGIICAYTDLILLKIFSSDSHIALYSVALQMSTVISFALGAINLNIRSQVAEDYHQLSRQQFQQKIKEYTTTIATISSVLIVIIIPLSYFIFPLYGHEYQSSYSIFLILMFGQIVNVFSGSVGLILSMSGYAKIPARTFYLAFCINIVLSLSLIHNLDSHGVAIGVATSQAIWNLILLYYVIKILKINPTVFTFLNKYT